MAAVCIRQNNMNLPAVNIQTDSCADAMTFLQVGPGSALGTCFLYKYKLTTVYQYKCTFRDEKKDTNRESSDTSEKGCSQVRRQQERYDPLIILYLHGVCAVAGTYSACPMYKFSIRPGFTI